LGAHVIKPGERIPTTGRRTQPRRSPGAAGSPWWDQGNMARFMRASVSAEAIPSAQGDYGTSWGLSRSRWLVSVWDLKPTT